MMLGVKRQEMLHLASEAQLIYNNSFGTDIGKHKLGLVKKCWQRLSQETFTRMFLFYLQSSLMYGEKKGYSANIEQLSVAKYNCRSSVFWNYSAKYTVAKYCLKIKRAAGECNKYYWRFDFN